jgi:hypothetical protein
MLLPPGERFLKILFKYSNELRDELSNLTDANTCRPVQDGTVRKPFPRDPGGRAMNSLS